MDTCAFAIMHVNQFSSYNSINKQFDGQSLTAPECIVNTISDLFNVGVHLMVQQNAFDMVSHSIRLAILFYMS